MADLITNKKAYHDFEVVEKIEAGIALTGTEVKSCRARNISLSDSYARVIKQEVLLLGVHISPYEQGNRENHEPKRPRKLLLHKAEIRKLSTATLQRGLTLVPLAIYLKKGRVKVSLGVCRGKTGSDKRESLKKKQADRDIRRIVRR